MAGLSGETRYHKVIGDTDNQDTKSTQSQQNESREDQDVENACSLVPRMLPLPQPILENILQPQSWMVKARVTFCSEQRYQPPNNDIGEAKEAQQVEEQEQNAPLSQPGNKLRGQRKAFHLARHLLCELPSFLVPARPELCHPALRGNLLFSGWRRCWYRSD